MLATFPLPILSFELLLDIGITPAAREIPGALEHTTPVKPIDGFVRRFDQLIARAGATASARTASAAAPLRVAVVGGGAGGVEIALALQLRLGAEHARRFGPTASAPPPEVALYTRGRVLEHHNATAQRKVRRVLQERGIHVQEGVGVERVAPGALHLSHGAVAPFDECLWCTQAAPAPWVQASGLATDARGFIAVEETLQSASHPFVFAAGDVASCAKHPRPKAGVFAVRQGPPLATNLVRFLEGAPLRPFVPQTNFLSIVSVGQGYAIATRGSWAVEGKWVWTLKDWIDRKFMNKFSVDLPEMDGDDGADPSTISSVASGAEALAVLTAAKMRCGGCGAKVGASTLSRVLARLAEAFPSLGGPAGDSNSILVGLESPDDAAVLRPPPPGHVTIQTVDFFRSFLEDPYLFGKIAANHALSDIYAMGATPSSALAIAVVPFSAEDKVEDTLFQMMSGALSVLEAAGCTLAGGHTCEGAELALGFSVTGSCPEGAVIRKSGAQPGDAIILTKPLGTGVLFAACMRRRAKGRWISQAIESMCRGNGPAAEAFQAAGCRALTDVTGFGLVGHLHEILRASGVRAELQLQSVPVLEGALQLAAEGIVSSLHTQNARSAAIVANAAAAAAGPAAGRWALLLDPQTSGGLVGCVPAAQAEDCLRRLREAGCADAAMIGTVLEGAAQEDAAACSARGLRQTVTVSGSDAASDGKTASRAAKGPAGPVTNSAADAPSPPQPQSTSSWTIRLAL